MTLLFFSNTWRGIDEKDLPVKPDFKELSKYGLYKDYLFYTGYNDADVLQRYLDELAAAKAEKSLEVENPKKCSFVDNGNVYFFTCKFIGFADKVKDDELYEWPGKAEIVNGKLRLEI